MVKSLCLTLVNCPGLTCIQEGLQYHGIVDFQLGVKLDSILLTDICTETFKCHICVSNSGSDLIINVHCSGESASQVGEFINKFQFQTKSCTVSIIYNCYFCFFIQFRLWQNIILFFNLEYVKTMTIILTSPTQNYSKLNEYLKHRKHKPSV